MAYGNCYHMAIWQYYGNVMAIYCHMAMNYVNYDFLLYFELPYKLPYGNKNPWLLRNVAEKILFPKIQKIKNSVNSIFHMEDGEII